MLHNIISVFSNIAYYKCNPCNKTREYFGSDAHYVYE